MRYAIYLRKSRADDTSEPLEVTLQRHRQMLEKYMQQHDIAVQDEDVFEEVVSGDSLYARPQMLRLLEAVEAGTYTGVLCVDIQRLGRGSMQDQGMILDAFKWSDTKIITPTRTYDLSNDMDETYTEFESFMGRQEYKMIKKRLRRGLNATIENGGYILKDTFDDTTILGWMIQTEDTEYSLPQPEIAGELLKISGARLENKGQFDGKWLDEKDPLQNAYVQANGQVINQDPYHYYTITESAEQELIKATNELHLMYLHATDKVLKDDNLLALFDIPKILWPRLRLSWQRRRHHMITGRMDFCMDERGLKVYEYNADSASCHTEAGLILERWAEQGYKGNGFNPAEGLINELAGAWKHSRARPFVHIMQDKDIEENYHAQFMEQALQQAGFETRILRGLDELGWDAAGQLIDGEGRLVNCVWKTWAWETAFDQIREVSDREFAAVPIRTGHPQNEVRLIDVLLRPEVLVFEPLWTVIPGNKAILPILWSLFPHHRYLLDTDFTVNDELVKTGYAVKPIAGRCGSNIDLVSHHEEVLDKTSGKFAEQKNIYQQLWCLPKVDGKYIQVCTFTVGGNYGGTCLRGDESLVIKKESDIEPLIVVKE